MMSKVFFLEPPNSTALLKNRKNLIALNLRHSGSKISLICNVLLIDFHIDMKTAFFVNLAVKVKIHLDRSRDEDSDRLVFMDFWDSFLRLSDFIKIRFKHFHRKFIRHLRVFKSKTPSTLTQSYGQLAESINMDSFSADELFTETDDDES